MKRRSDCLQTNFDCDQPKFLRLVVRALPSQKKGVKSKRSMGVLQTFRFPSLIKITLFDLREIFCAIKHQITCGAGKTELPTMRACTSYINNNEYHDLNKPT